MAPRPRNGRTGGAIRVCWSWHPRRPEARQPRPSRLDGRGAGRMLARPRVSAPGRAGPRARAGRSTGARYVTTVGSVNELAEAADERTQPGRREVWPALDLLTLDELAYVHLDPRGAELLFHGLDRVIEEASDSRNPRN